LHIRSRPPSRRCSSMSVTRARAVLPHESMRPRLGGVVTEPRSTDSRLLRAPMRARTLSFCSVIRSAFEKIQPLRIAWAGEIIAVKNAGNVVEVMERSCRWPNLEQVTVCAPRFNQQHSDKTSLDREFHHEAPCDSVILINCIHEPNHY